MALTLAFTTVAHEADARRLGELALAQRLAACVQWEPIQSLYEWQGQCVQEGEWRVLFKTTAARYPALQGLLAAQHPYELPAIYALQTAQVTEPFAVWVAEAVAPPLLRE